MFAVAAGGPGFVAVGDGYQSGSFAAVWTSVDGRSWARVPSSPTFDNASMRMLVPWDQGLLAIGCVTYLELCAGTLLMVSADGLTWNRVPADAFQGARISDVAFGGPGLVAVGFCLPGSGVAECPDRLAVWVSEDGVTWSDVSLNDAAFGGINAVASRAAGFVAFGTYRDEGPGPGSVVTLRTSLDGLAWTLLPTQDVFADATVHAVRTVGETFFALGQRGREEPIPTIWRSVDGLDWAIVLKGSPSDTGSLSDLATDGTRLVGVGDAYVADAYPSGAMIWTSPGAP
jgi:hypothetical protein